MRRLTCEALQRIGRLSDGVVQLAAGGDLQLGVGGSKPEAAAGSSGDDVDSDSESEGSSCLKEEQSGEPGGREAVPSTEAELAAKMQQELVGVQDGELHYAELGAALS